MRYTGLEIKKLNQYRQPFDPYWRAILNKHFKFYQLLYPSEKKKFEKRVQKFIVNKTFVPKKMAEVTDEMKVMIAASAVQLTFGLSNIHFEHFATIEVHPSKYYSDESSSINLGEVQLKGVIVLSWKDFVRGYKYPDTAMNIGLHEMAHALELENKIPNSEFEFLNPNNLDQLRNVTKKEITKIRNGEQNFLRKYAATNDQEFFAVSVEYFFEKPHQLKNEIPELYQALASLLKQDPIKRFSI